MICRRSAHLERDEDVIRTAVNVSQRDEAIIAEHRRQAEDARMELSAAKSEHATIRSQLESRIAELTGSVAKLRNRCKVLEQKKSADIIGFQTDISNLQKLVKTTLSQLVSRPSTRPPARPASASVAVRPGIAPSSYPHQTLKAAAVLQRERGAVVQGTCHRCGFRDLLQRTSRRIPLASTRR